MDATPLAVSVTFCDAEQLHPPRGYRHAVAVTGGTTVYCAGQVSLDVTGEVVGPGDHAAQAHRALLNVVLALAAAGAEAGDIIKLTYYVVGMNEAVVAAVNRGLGRACREAGVPAVPATMVGVESLSLPALLIEADAIAVHN